MGQSCWNCLCNRFDCGAIKHCFLCRAINNRLYIDFFFLGQMFLNEKWKMKNWKKNSRAKWLFFLWPSKPYIRISLLSVKIDQIVLVWLVFDDRHAENCHWSSLERIFQIKFYKSNNWWILKQFICNIPNYFPIFIWISMLLCRKITINDWIQRGIQ